MIAAMGVSSLPRAARPLVSQLSIAFTPETFQRVLVLLVGAVLAPGRRTVAACLWAAGRWSGWGYPGGCVLQSVPAPISPPRYPSHQRAVSAAPTLPHEPSVVDSSPAVPEMVGAGSI